MMHDRGKVFEAFRNCITEPKCRDCPWEQCEQFNQKKVEIPVTLALDVINLLKEQEAYIEHLEEMNEKYGYINIVRCKDCKFWYKDECSHLCKITGDLHPTNWFCADGERK